MERMVMGSKVKIVNPDSKFLGETGILRDVGKPRSAIKGQDLPRAFSIEIDSTGNIEGFFREDFEII